MVLAPSPILSVSFEDVGDGPAVHFHAGGQGFWVSRLLASLGVEVTLCGTFGGEAGDVLRVVVERAGIELRAVTSTTDNGVSVRDDRGTTSRVLVATMPPPLARHELDDLYGMALAAGLDSDICVLAGSTASGASMPPDAYRRLAADLLANGRRVIADLSGPALTAAAQAGVTILKVSAEELIRDGRARSDSVDDITAAIDRLRAGATFDIVVSRGPQPALACLDDQTFEVLGPTLEPFQEHGAGDAMTAGIAAGIARGATHQGALRLGAAAGTLNVSRHGFGTGTRSEIEALAEHVTVRPLKPHRASPPAVTTPDELAAKVRPT
jgi:1-phosphofructokinase